MSNLNIVFDLDSTLADCDHRLHFITKSQEDRGRGSKPDWERFFAECLHDEPILPMTNLFQSLVDCAVEQNGTLQSHMTISIWSGRSSEVYTETVEWLKRYMGLRSDGGAYADPELAQYRAVLWAFHTQDLNATGKIVPIDFRMRLEGKFIQDDVLKRSWLRSIETPVHKPNLVFEDRKRVVDMWRAEGVQCCQVAAGDF